MRVTKTFANKLAIQCVGSVDLEIKKIQKEISDFYYEQKVKTIPEEVLQLFNKYKNYFKFSSSGYIKWRAQTYWTSIDKSFPSNDKSLFLKDDELCNKFEKLINKEKDLKEKRRKLLKEFEESFFNLRTTKKIRETFPEISHLIKDEEENKLMLNYQDTRNKLVELI